MREPFFLFAGESYYPAGGWDDYRGRFETREAAQKFFDTRQGELTADWKPGTLWPGWDWAEIVQIPATGAPVRIATWDHKSGWATPEERAAAQAEETAKALAVWEARRATLLPCGCAPETPLCAQPGGSCGRCVKHCTCTVEFKAPAEARRGSAG